LTLNLSPNPEYTAPTASTTNHSPSRSPFVCPLSFKELSGTVPFLALRPCGCVYSEASIRGIIPNLTKGTAVQSVKDKEEIPNEAKPVVEAKKGTVACPNCGLYFDPTLPTSILQINPPKEVQDILLENLLTARAAAKSSKKRKATTTDTTESELPTKSKTKTKAKGDKAEIREKRPTMNTDGMHKTVAQKLADQEQKRLKAQEGMSDAVRSMFKSKDGDQRGTGGAADFFGRTFTRVSQLIGAVELGLTYSTLHSLAKSSSLAQQVCLASFKHHFVLLYIHV
jgi:hypothetical protein